MNLLCLESPVHARSSKYIRRMRKRTLHEHADARLGVRYEQ